MDVAWYPSKTTTVYLDNCNTWHVKRENIILITNLRLTLWSRLVFGHPTGIQLKTEIDRHQDDLFTFWWWRWKYCDLSAEQDENLFLFFCIISILIHNVMSSLIVIHWPYTLSRQITLIRFSHDDIFSFVTLKTIGVSCPTTAYHKYRVSTQLQGWPTD